MPAGITRAPAKALSYAQITSNQTGIGTSATDVAGLSITFTPGNRPVWLEAAGWVLLNTTGGIALVYLTDSANQQVGEWYQTMVAGAYAPVWIRRRLTILTPGTAYTMKVRAQAPASATLDFQAHGDVIPTTLGGPAFLRAYEE